MEFKGTKGEWKVGGNTEDGMLISVSQPMRDVATVWRYGDDYLEKKEMESNAKLIACAPEMLEMLNSVQVELNSCIRKLQFHGEEVDYQTLGEINLLIKKATTI